VFERLSRYHERRGACAAGMRLTHIKFAVGVVRVIVRASFEGELCASVGKADHTPGRCRPVQQSQQSAGRADVRRLAAVSGLAARADTWQRQTTHRCECRGSSAQLQAMAASTKTALRSEEPPIVRLLVP